jgi:hypothetical protein
MNKSWKADNPRPIHKRSLHNEKVYVLCALSARRIFGHTFCDDTVIAARYVNNILCPIFA